MEEGVNQLRSEYCSYLRDKMLNCSDNNQNYTTVNSGEKPIVLGTDGMISKRIKHYLFGCKVVGERILSSIKHKDADIKDLFFENWRECIKPHGII